MTNEELVQKISQEIPEYSIGLHNISGDRYKRIISLHDNSSSYNLGKEDITVEDIANHILQTGLIVKECMPKSGIYSTVNFNSYPELNYRFGKYIDLGKKRESICNILIAIPSFLKYHNKEYFIGDLKQGANLSGILLFKELVDPEFIYGYYTKRIWVENRHYQFAEQLDFYPNSQFIHHKSLEEQEKLTERILERNPNSIQMLELANNNEPLDQLFTDEHDEYVIQRTRKQRDQYIRR